MNRAQQLETRRMTDTMRSVLLHAEAGGLILPNEVRSARILARRGFLVVPPKDEEGFIYPRLTEFGKEAVARMKAAP